MSPGSVTRPARRASCTRGAGAADRSRNVSGRTTPELWELAISQIDDGTPVHGEDLGDGVTAFVGESFFVASRVLDLERYAGLVPEAGALVAIPQRHMLIVHPIKTTQAVKALNSMIGAAAHFFGQGPGSIVPHVFWWRHDRSLLRVSAGVRDGHHYVIPPDEFVDVLNALPGPPDPAHGERRRPHKR